MTNTKPTLARTGLATLVLFGAVALGTTASAEAKPATGARHGAYMKYDKNGDGKIGPLEQQAAITARVQRIMLKADKNGDGQIGPFEIRTAPGYLSSWLGQADLNNNGFVTRIELRMTLAKRWNSGEHKSWGNKGKKYKGKKYKDSGYKGNGAPAKPAGWNVPKPKPPVVNVRDHRQPAPKPPVVNVRDHRQPAPKPLPAPLSSKRPSTKVFATKGRVK